LTEAIFLNALTIIGFFVMILVNLVLIVIVLMQPSKDAGSADTILSGSMENFFGRNRSRTLEGRLAGITRWLAIAFGVLCIGLVLMLRFFP